MHKYTFIIWLLMCPALAFSQSRNTSDWINFGSTHFAKWLQIAPGKLGPNALPIPRMDYALIGDESKIEIGAHYHQMTGDTAINSYFNYRWNIAPGRAVVEIWGEPSETFRLTNDVRDERQIYYDDNGWSTEAGDLLISTYVQLLKNKKYIPDLSLNYTLKTTTGVNWNGRYTDASMNYFYLAAGKSIRFKGSILDEIRIAALCGFYVWQTNKVEMAQDEGPVIEAGIQLHKKDFIFYTEFGGYSGYDAYEFMERGTGQDRIQGYNDPLILRTRLEKTGRHFNFTVEYQHGFRDYFYETFRLGIIYHFKALTWYQ